MILTNQKKTIESKPGQIGPAGGEILQIGIEKQGLCRGQLATSPPIRTIQAQVFSEQGLHLGAQLRKCRQRGKCSIRLD